MVKLSGILEYSMGGFLCLRGFASYKMLSAISKPNKEVQRDLIDEHKGDMAQFLNNGDYMFFPEVILSTNLADGISDTDKLELFHRHLHSEKTWNKSIGDFHFNMSRHTFKNTVNKYVNIQKNERIYLTHIKFDETVCELIRIDGNHRLSAADAVKNDFIVPFCLLIFRYPSENDQFSRAIFHNINAKQVPLKLEENLKVILESSNVFSDDKLIKDPSFGWKYYLARKLMGNEDFLKNKTIQEFIEGNKYTYLIEVLDLLLNEKLLPENDQAVEEFIKHLYEIDSALQEENIKDVHKNIAVAGTLSYYKLSDSEKYQAFIRWSEKNDIDKVNNIHMANLIEIFDKVYENMPKSVFISMQFSPETEDTYLTIKYVIDTLKYKNGIKLNIIKVDEHTDGFSDEIYHRIVNGIKESSFVIADLSYGNKNVHQEIGMAQGLGKKVFLLYHVHDDVEPNKEIGSNLSMHDQLRFKNQQELYNNLLKRIRHFLGILSE